MRTLGVHPRVVHHWWQGGLVRRDRYHFPLTPSERRVVRCLDSLRRLGGVDPEAEPANGNPEERRRLQVAVANAARNNPPGTIVELPSPVSYVRVIVVVPEP